MDSQKRLERQGLNIQSNFGLIGSFSLGYLLCIALVAVPIFMAGIWKIIANTRFLDLLMSSGIIAYTDMDFGFIKGIPDLGDYLKSQDAIDGRLVLICLCIYIGFYFVKAIQFHSIAGLYGLKGSFGDHTSAYFYGIGLNRFLPYNTGDIAVVSAIEGRGESGKRASSTLYVMDIFVCFEIAFFFLLGLFLVGWKITISQTVPAVVFFWVLYYITRSSRTPRRYYNGEENRHTSIVILQTLANDPWILIKLGVLSLFAFFLDDITPFIISQAFTSEYVHLNVPFLIIQTGVVAGYIASRVPITPGCIGQYEFGFATALVMGGSALPEAISIALLDGFIRHGTVLVLLIIVKLKNGVATDLRTVLSLFKGKMPQYPVDSE